MRVKTFIAYNYDIHIKIKNYSLDSAAFILYNNKSAMAKVSVIMSVKDAEAYVEEAVNSILNQSFRDFEFIIVDDGSRDGTVRLLKELEGKDNRIKIITNAENMGLTRSLNKAIASASGEYLARMDADDVSMPQRFEKQAYFLDDNTAVAVLGTSYYGIDDNGAVVSTISAPTKDEDIKKNLISGNPFCHPSVMIRKSILDKVGSYKEEFRHTEDYELWFRIAKSGARMANLEDFLFKRRYTGRSICFEYENEQLWWLIKIRSKAILEDKQYPFWDLVFLIRPFIVMVTPLGLRKFIRKYLLGSKIYG